MTKRNDKLQDQWVLSLKIIGVVTAIILLFWLLQQIVWVVSVFIISVFIVYALNPATEYLEQQKLSRTTASLITFSAFILIIFGLLYLTIPRLYSELMALTRFAPWLFDYIEAEGYMETLQFFMEQFDIIDDTHEQGFLLPALEELPRLSRRLFQLFFQLISMFFEVLILLFLVFYLLRDFREIKHSIISIIPLKYQKNGKKVLEVIDVKVGQFLLGNLIRCSLVGVVTGLGLFFLDIRFYFILALIATVLNLIAYIGPFMASIPGVLIALSYSIETAIIVAILYIIIQTIDAFILYPVLLGKAVDLSPFAVIVAISIGGALYGAIGFIIAVPIAAILKVLLQYYYLDNNI